MSTRRILLSLLVFAAVGVFSFGLGFGVGRRTAPKAEFDYSAPIVVMNLDNPGQGSYRLVPYLYRTEGTERRLAPSPDSGAQRVDLFDSRVVLFVTREPVGGAVKE